MFDSFIEGWKFPDKAKSISFAGLGEPLINKKHIPELIVRAKEIANKTILITNGFLLNKEVIDTLIDSDLDIVRISLQGLDAADYKKYCGVNIDYQKFLDNLSYFYKNKKNTKIWVKMPDFVVDTEDKKQLYHELFGDKCDNLTTMIIQKLYNGVDYSELQLDENTGVFQDIFEKRDVTACPHPFYALYLLPNGDIFPCCAIYNLKNVIGNINIDSIYNIWNGAKLKKFRYKLLKDTYKNLDACKNCLEPVALDNSYDNIDTERERLLKIYNNSDVSMNS